ncbi:hydantoinase B/oxoprolinase family protein [Halomarina halobia]|uniref:Hydantoinase B/oxoprolinase family protein n=1 Tax=Halomarina halobia TaxID=3033386 RepID=A0ABD6ADY6_9EURY|nr:hydantoinase B/oxoprolinase family protein [Halomarina sp. PSR21]
MASHADGNDEQHQGTNVWDDFRHGYVPRDELDIHPDVTLHREAEDDVDPVTYNVLRHRLYTINEEHGHTLENVSGSPVAYFAQDFNPTILTADGEVVFQGPYIQFFSPIAELQVKWVLENRSGNPGIEPGDMFFSNDPWVGSTHQPDVFFLAPVFRDDELFCWVVNTLHQYDIGGISAGSFCPSADDVFGEPTPIPPTKVVEDDEVRQDIRQMYLRHSRLPNLVGLDFNAQVAGCRVTRDRIHDVIDEYGAETVKGVMNQVIDDSENRYLQKIRKIPDGTWRAREYMEGSQTGDSDVYPVEIQMTKRGDTLTFRNEGTAESQGVMNISYAGFRTAIMSVLNPLMLYDELFVASGAFRHIEIETTPGTLNRAEWPAGCSPGGTTNIEFSIGLIQDVMGRMLSAAPDLKADIVSDTPSLSTMAQAGVDQWGNPFGTMNLDIMGAGIGATPNKDGVDAGGYLWGPKGPMPNIENNEQDYPILYLYKEIVEDSGAPGERRGGATMQYGFIPHKTERIHNVFCGNSGVTPISAGLASYPGPPSLNQVVEDTDVTERLENQDIPQSLDEFGAEVRQFAPKSEYTQNPNDVVQARNGTPSGYGDPLKRDPERVAEDIVQNVVSETAARDIYGVVVDRDGAAVEVIDDETAARREELRRQRLEDGVVPAEGA